MLKIIVATLISLLISPPALASEVRTYASQIKDVDSINSHWFETDNGVILIDTQRILPEAERALAHLWASTSKPVIAIFITHPHTDHYGGLPVWKAAFPDATIYLTETALRSIREDSKGYNAARTTRHGDRFASQAALDAALSEAVVVRDTQTLEIDGTRLCMKVFGPSEAEDMLTIYDQADDRLFVGDLLNVGVPAVPFESLENWLGQLDEIERLYGSTEIYQGHGPAPIRATEAAEQRRFLVALRDLVRERVADQRLSKPEQDEIIFALEARWPFYSGVAGNTRREMFAFDAEVVAKQLGAAVEE